LEIAMPPFLKSMFVDHPESVGESYGQHFAVALGFAFALLVAGFAALIHVLIPGLCKTTASSTIRQLHSRIAARDHQSTGQPEITKSS
jgi:Family of unknown function (DUF6356)